MKGERHEKIIRNFSFIISYAMPAVASEPFGIVYQDTTHQLLGSGSVAPAKMGTATCTSYFGIVALGNCSVKQAMQNGRINSLSHADQATKNILGFKKVTTRAFGQ